MQHRPPINRPRTPNGRDLLALALALVVLGAASSPVQAAVVFQTVSPYHHIQVIDQGGVRLLSFDGSMETRMSLRDPLQGHFEYTEFFHLAWLWNTNLQRALMIGLGGGSAQRSFLHYYPEIQIDSVEIDAAVVAVATNFFGVQATDRHRIHVADGRVYLRRTREQYDLIAMDAYVKHRYGSSIPPHLVTREFMQMARDRLNPQGVLAYNVIGTTHGWQSGIVGALARTMLEVFPYVYFAPASDSLNVVLFATRAPDPRSAADQHLRALRLIREQKVTLPGFRRHVIALRRVPRPDGIQAPVLTDDFAPVESLTRSTER